MMVELLCLTTKRKFTVERPNVVVLKNGRYAYKERCPWDGNNGKALYAFKWASKAAYLDSIGMETSENTGYAEQQSDRSSEASQ